MTSILWTVLFVLIAQAILAGAFCLGYRVGRKRPAARLPNQDDQERQRLEQLQKAFRNIMSYDLNTALRGKPNG